MLAKAFHKLLALIEAGRVPAIFHRLVWKSLYQFISRKWQHHDWCFMNYGWLPPATEPAIQLDSADEQDRYFIGLYSRLAASLPMRGARVLEVGSGRGGGAAWLARYHQPESLVGLDFSAQAIAFSRRRHAGIAGLEFTEGDAMRLPFADASFDVVVNVESSHCYGDMAQFVREVARVLRPGGMFGWVDMRSVPMLEATEQAFEQAGLNLVEADLLNEGVIRALDAADERKAEILAQIKFGARAFREFSGAKGTLLYKALARKDVLYLLKVFRKQDAGPGAACG